MEQSPTIEIDVDELEAEAIRGSYDDLFAPELLIEEVLEKPRLTVAEYMNPKPIRTVRSERNIAWIEKHCVVPEGKHVGKPVRLREFQRDALRDIYSSPTRLYIYSVGRKNAKTALSAFLLLLHICGPEARPNGQLYSTAQSKEQAAVLFNLAAKCARQSPTLNQRGLLVIRDTMKEILCPELGTKYRALSADAATAYGLSPFFAVHDELGQVKGPQSELYEAVETAFGAQDDPLSIVISTQAPTDNDLLSRLIDDAIQGEDPRIKCRIYSAPMDADAFSEDTIRIANPAFGDFQSRDETLLTARSAQRMPSKEPLYRNLILNQRVETVSLFCSPRVWKENGAKPQELDYDEFMFCGLDLSETTDLTAFVRIQCKDGVWSVRPTFWLPEFGLREKSKEDRQMYDVWAGMEDGFGGKLLETTPGKAIDYEFVAEYLYRSHRNECPITKCAFDRYNWKHFQPYLKRAGFEEWELVVEGTKEDKADSKFVGFGQGFVSMSPALRSLETLLLNGKLAHGMHPVLTMCAANAVTQIDPAGNKKLSKSKSRGRIDGLVALAMAVSTAETEMLGLQENSGGSRITVWE